jgi:Rieske Fe-S protein
VLTLGVSSCNDEGTVGTNYIPDVPVNITINTDLPLYFHLQTPGAYSLIQGGYRGIFLIHHFDDNIYAIERTCSYQSELDCAIIQVDTSIIQLRCGTYSDSGYVACCQSQFSFDGFVINGPATFPLKKYQVFENGNLLTIKN